MKTARAQNGSTRVRYAEFAKRLELACSKVADVPEYGRQRWLRRKLSEEKAITVSTETISKWFAGEVSPRLDKVRSIAELLNVDWHWLLDTGSDSAIEDSTGSPAALNIEAVRTELSSLVDKAVRGSPTLIGRDGRAEAVIVSAEEWHRLASVPSLGRLLMSAPIDGEQLPPRSAKGLRSIDLRCSLSIPT